jgi:hypothetical protein
VRDGATVFGERNARAYLDPRSHVFFEDAREFFARGQRRYDVVVSEPSNPWVSGVASLFTQEFYRGVKRSLTPDGLLVQWVHTYELSDALLAQMTAALLAEFPGSEIYAANRGDLVIVAPVSGRLQAASDEPWRSPALAAELRRLGLASPVDLAARRVGGPAVLRTYVRLQGVEPHSDFYPTVSLFAPEQRFRGNKADLLMQLASDGLPVLQVLDCLPTWPASETIHLDPLHPLLKARQEAVWAADRVMGRGLGQPHGAGLSRIVDALRFQREPGAPLDDEAVLLNAANLAQASLAHLTARDQQAFWDPVVWQRARPGLSTGTLALLTLYDATARRDWPAAHTAAERILSGAVAPAPSGIKEQVLVLDMLAGLALGQADAVSQRESRWGRDIPMGSLAATRRFLKSWEDGREPVCAAEGSRASASTGR